MFERFTERARQVVVLAQEEARELKHDYTGTEHILLGVLREEESLGAWVLESLDITVERVRAHVIQMVGTGKEEPSKQIPFTPRAKKVLELSLREALSLRHNYIGTEHILLGLVREHEGVAARILLECDAAPDKIRGEVVRRLSAATAPETSHEQRTEDRPGQSPAATTPQVPDLDDVSDAELDHLIDSRVHEEQSLSQQVRRMRDEIDALRAARDNRRRRPPGPKS